MAELSRAEKQTIPFLRMAAIEMRRMADDGIDVAERLRVMASKLDAEADDLSRLAQAAGSAIAGDDQIPNRQSAEAPASPHARAPIRTSPG